MEVTEFGITEVLQPKISVLEAVSIMALQLFRESNTVFPASTTIEVKLEHHTNGPSPMEVTEFGISIEVKLEHP